MIGYVTIGTSDMARACAFYDALLAEIGGKQLMGMDRIKFYGTGGAGAMLAVCIPYDQKAQDCGNGNMVAINAGDRATVDKLTRRRASSVPAMKASRGSGCPFSTVPMFATSMATSSASTR